MDIVQSHFLRFEAVIYTVHYKALLKVSQGCIMLGFAPHLYIRLSHVHVSS